MNIKIADRLVELRKKYGYSQEDLANKLGLSRQAVSKWERAEASPDTDNLICLAKLYNVSLDELLSTDRSIEDIAEETKEREEESKAQSHSETGKKEEKDSNKEKKMTAADRKQTAITSTIGGLTALVITIIYLTLGFLLPDGKGWINYWMLFILVPVIPSIYEAFYKKKITAFCYPCLIAAIYCYLGMNIANGWHPWWVLFVTIPAFYTGFGAIDRLIHKNDPDYQEEDKDEE